MFSPPQIFTEVHGFAGPAQTTSLFGNSNGNHAAAHRYKLPVEIYGSPVAG
jgi:hypothetical protein